MPASPTSDFYPRRRVFVFSSELCAVVFTTVLTLQLRVHMLVVNMGPNSKSFIEGTCVQSAFGLMVLPLLCDKTQIFIYVKEKTVAALLNGTRKRVKQLAISQSQNQYQNNVNTSQYFLH